MKKNNKGFSLVELIVVIAIMAILAAVAIPTFAHFITKANEASDAELLNNINYFFNLACVENGVDVKDVTAAEWDKTNKCVINVKVNGADNDDIEASFVLHFGEMKNENFIIITDIVFDVAKHEFVDLANASEITLNYGDKGNITISRDQLDALKNSAFGSLMESDELLGKVDYVTLLAASLLEGEDNTFADLIMGEEYAAILAANLGIDLDAEGGQEAFLAAVGPMLEAKMDLLIANGDFDQDADRTEGSDLYNAAYHQIVANNAVLHAANTSPSISDDILSILGDSNSKGTMLETIDSDSGKGLAQVSAAYALYTAYAERTGKTVSDNPAEVLIAIDNDQDFKDYINNVDGEGYAQADLDGYLASMNMINSNVKDNETAVSDILVNGFANEDLVGMLGQATGK